MGPIRIPGIEYAAMPKAGTKASALSWPPRLIVIHATDNTASRFAEASYASTRTDAQAYWTSAHAYVDTGGPLGSLPLNLQAWAAYSYANQHGIHIEMCGHDDAVPAATIAHTARVVRTLLDLGAAADVKLSPADIAAGKSGICGHRDITLAHIDQNDHQDPGANFDWSAFMALVNGGDDMALNDIVPNSASSGTGGKDRTVAQILGDLANLRAVLIGEKTAAQAGYGASTPLAQVLAVAAAGPAKPVDTQTLAAALAPLLSQAGHDIDVATLVSALESDAGQAALVKAANTAEDS